MQSRFRPRYLAARKLAFLLLLPALFAAATPAVASAGPILEVSKTRINLTSFSSGSGVFFVSNAGDPVLEWTASVDKPWVDIQQHGGSGQNGYVLYDADLDGRIPGETANITIASNGGTAVVEIVYRTLPPVNGTVGVYADPAGVNCSIADAAPGLLTVHVVHTATAGATAAQLWAPMPSCMTGATWLTDTPAFGVTLGNSQVGVSVGYGTCLAAPILVTSINYMVSGQSQACCAYPVLGDPLGSAAPYIVTVDCNEDLQLLSGATTIINGDASCPCMLTVRTEETTWGKVKSLYASDPTKSN